MPSKNKYLLSISSNGKKIFSQSNQDGIIEYLLDNLEENNKLKSEKFCIEFGYNSNSLTGGSGPNTTNLIVNKGYKSLLLDIDYENKDINLYKHKLTSDNICSIFKKYNVPKEPWFISIDVDSTDLWLMNAILSEYNPYLISVEYNAHFPITKAITFIDVKDGNPENSNRVYGASLKALNIVAEKHGYSLVHVTVGLDAFFIRNDLIIGEPFNKFGDHYLYETGVGTSINWHPPQTLSTIGLTKFLDYEVYLSTNGDVKKSIEAALPTVKKYIFRMIPVLDGKEKWWNKPDYEWSPLEID